MLAFLLSPVGRWATTAAAFVILLGVAWGLGDAHGHKVKQAEIDALKLSWAKAWDAEATRQAQASHVAIVGYQDKLASADQATADAEKAADDLQAQLDAQPIVPGRGATAADVKALNP